MHHKYHSAGFVLANFNSGEANKAYKIFTRELGLVIASAQSVRAPASKLRASLVDYSLGRFTFIQTRRGWRITDATTEKNLFFTFEENSKLLLCSRFFSLLQKLLPDEEPNPELFDGFLNDMEFLNSNIFSTESFKNFECVIILKMLSSLGYLDKTGPWQPFIKTGKTNMAILEGFSPLRKQAIKEINVSFKESQLV